MKRRTEAATLNQSFSTDSKNNTLCVSSNIAHCFATTSCSGMLAGSVQCDHCHVSIHSELSPHTVSQCCSRYPERAACPPTVTPDSGTDAVRAPPHLVVAASPKATSHLFMQKRTVAATHLNSDPPGSFPASFIKEPVSIDCNPLLCPPQPRR